MKDGFVKVAAATPNIKVADCMHNGQEIVRLIESGCENKVNVIVFPELAITGATCDDLFLQDRLINGAKDTLCDIVTASQKAVDMLIFVGLPYKKKTKLYNVTAVIKEGKILALIPKNCADTTFRRYFSTPDERLYIENINNQEVPFAKNIVFECEEMPEFTVATEPISGSLEYDDMHLKYMAKGISLIVNSAADWEESGKRQYRYNMVCAKSAFNKCAYIYANAGMGESTQDLVYSGHSLIVENGECLEEKEPFSKDMITSVVDLKRVKKESESIETKDATASLYTVTFNMNMNVVSGRVYNKMPFIPKENTDEVCKDILNIQTYGLRKRLEHTSCKTAIIGVSGGLDSTLALLVVVNAFDMLALPRKNIKAITMPCFGTSNRTYANALKLMELLGVDLKEISIKDAVLQHFKDIGQDENVHDVTFENAQARERTQILMDMANKENGMVIGTGDLSELALGFATYNGDHMSMYGVNASIPKTLVRQLVRSYGKNCGNEELNNVLLSIVDTPVSPELLPTVEGNIAQITENIVGPYELNDFFIYHILKYGYEPKKILRMASEAFSDEYTLEEVLKWLKLFYRRFFTQQFKRSCMPDGPKASVISVSPRNGLKMPSDAVAKLWLDELNEI